LLLAPTQSFETWIKPDIFYKLISTANTQCFPYWLGFQATVSQNFANGSS
jgi:hypothetical protein